MRAGKHLSRLAALAALGIGASAGAGASSALPAGPPPANAGLRLVWQEQAGKLSLRLVTAGAQNLRLGYRLSLTGTSRSVNSGNVQVRPGDEHVVGNWNLSPSRGWHAVLEVSGDQTYRLEVPE